MSKALGAQTMTAVLQEMVIVGGVNPEADLIDVAVWRP